MLPLSLTPAAILLAVLFSAAPSTAPISPALESPPVAASQDAARSLSAWIAQLKDADPAQRLAACEVLWKIGAPAREALPVLEELSKNDSSEGVKWMASRAVSQIRASLPPALPERQPQIGDDRIVNPPPAETRTPFSARAGAPAPNTGEMPAARLRLGIVFTVNDAQGVRIVDVEADSPAFRAQLNSGDVILEIGSRGLYQPRPTQAEFAGFVSGLTPDVPVRLLIQRGTRRFETAITPERVIIDPGKYAQAKAAYDQGRKSMSIRDYAGAAASFRQSIALQPAVSAPYSALGEVYFHKGDAASEIAVLKDGVAKAPDYNLYSQLGFALRTANRFDEAIPVFEKAILVMPPHSRDSAVFEQLGFCYMKKRQYRQALPLFETAYAINSRSPAAVYFLGGCHDVLNNRDQAVRYYRDFLALRSNQADWNKYAERRLNALTNRDPSTANTGDQILAVMDTIFRDIIRVRNAGVDESNASTETIPLPVAAGDLAGEWDWFDRSVVVMRSDGTFSIPNRLTGTWRLIDPTLRRYVLVWSHGFTDTLTLSQDGRRLEGANNKGTRIWGTRR